MPHTVSPKQVVFGPDSMEISEISIGNIIVKGVANHASKAYEFSHVLPYSDSVRSQLPFKRKGKFILPNPFSYDNVTINVSDSESEAEDQVESFFGIEEEVQSDPDPYPVPTPNPRPIWDKNIIEAVGKMVGDSSDKSRTRS